MSVRFPIGIAIALALVLGMLLLATAENHAGAAGARTSCGDVKTPKNDNGFKLKRDIKVKADQLDCHTAKKTLKKFVKTFNADDHTNVNGFDCRIPQKGDGSVFYACRKGDKLAKGTPKG